MDNKIHHNSPGFDPLMTNIYQPHPAPPPPYPGPPKDPPTIVVRQPVPVSSGVTVVSSSGGHTMISGSGHTVISQGHTMISSGGSTMISGGHAVMSGGVATVVVARAMGSKPTAMTCRACHADIVTRVDTKSTMRTHIIAAILCVFCCWPCVCIPYCMDSCKNAEHYCPNCHAYIGTYHSH